MPVRIYEIAKRLGVENKVVLAKAKELGIGTARVPSSSLDKITAEFLEQQLGGVRPKPPEPVPPPPEPVVVLTAATTAPAPVFPAESAAEVTELLPPALAPDAAAAAPAAEIAAPEATAEPFPLLAEEPVTPTATASVQPALELPAGTAPVAQTPAGLAPAPPPPAAPAAPKLGEKIGFIQLPQRPQPRLQSGRSTLERPGAAPVQRPAPKGAQRTASAAPPARPPTSPAPTRFMAPTTGELITLKPPVVVRELAEKLNRKPFQIIADLMEIGVFATVNQAIEEPIAQQICAKYGFRFEVEKRERGGGTVHAPKRPVEVDQEDTADDLQPRAPVVTIMGHVDHGKTTLLDTIRKSNVAAREAGGITQHIGAYTISIPHPERKRDLQQITFLDTPGHHAFSRMRARGATVTDIVVLVVAANDGVMPQTLEALSHAQAARVPILVAVNKSDHPNANPMKVRQQLQDKGLVCEEWGGHTIFVDCSALTGQGVDRLLEMLVLQAEVLELKANPTRPARGNVIESGIEPGGPVATVLVRKGTLHTGDTLLCGPYYGRVRALINEEGNRLKEAGPSVAVKVLGLNGVPEAGVEFGVVANEKDARAMAEERELRARAQEQDARPAVSFESFLEQFKKEEAKVLRLIVKADTQGSVEAIVGALKEIPTDKIALEIIHSAVGTVTQYDVNLAASAQAVILGFHTRIDSGVSDLAKHQGVEIRLYAIIYELVDEVKEAMAGLLEPTVKEVVVGAAEVRKIFPLSKGGNVAGCVVASGRVLKGRVRVLRRKSLVFEGLTASLRRFQDEVHEVRAGMECGIRLDGFNDFQIGDLIESYQLEKVPQKL